MLMSLAVNTICVSVSMERIYIRRTSVHRMFFMRRNVMWVTRRTLPQALLVSTFPVERPYQVPTRCASHIHAHVAVENGIIYYMLF